MFPPSILNFNTYQQPAQPLHFGNIFAPSSIFALDTPKKRKTKADLTFFQNFIAGGIAGVSEILCLYPLDLIKTRMHLDARSGHKAGMIASIRSIFKESGPRGLYRGMLWPVLIEAPKRSTKFGTFTTYKGWLSDDDGKISVLKTMLAGTMAGLSEATLINPLEVVKVRVQDKSLNHLYKNSIHALQVIAKTDGVGALFQGIEATWWRHGLWNFLYFGLQPVLRSTVPEPNDSAGLSMLYNFCMGTIAATIATTVNCPPDVAKSLIQAQLYKDPHKKYRHTFQTLKIIYQSEGISGWYRGYIPKVARLGPGGGILMVVFNLVVDFFTEMEEKKSL